MTTKKAADKNEPLWAPTDVVATITLTAHKVHVTALPLKPAVPKDYLYALEEALCVSIGNLWQEVMKAAGVELEVTAERPAMIPDHEGPREPSAPKE